MKTARTFIAFLLITGVVTSCKKDKTPEPEPPAPGIDNIEIGLGNNNIGIIGRDFHFEMDVLAGDKIENVRISIRQRGNETYSHEWSHEITWDEYKGAKDANVHKHFDIPEDAAEGEYDLTIIVNDENGTKLEEVMSISIYLPENLPVDPQLFTFNVLKDGKNNGGFFYRDGEFAADDQLSKGEVFSAQATIAGVKGDGKMYLVLINKALNHRPETVADIDFSKAIIYDVFEHENEEEVYSFSNAVFDSETFTWVRSVPSLTIGSTQDNNAPQPSPVNGDKAWESGDYYFGVVYENTTYDINFHHYIEFEIVYQ